MKILISGAGVAGPTLAYWLHRGGHETVLVERAPSLREGGYIIDFWGVGYDVAEKMGLKDKLHEIGYAVEEVRLVDKTGKKAGGFSAEVFRRPLNGRFVSLPRSALADTIYDNLEGRVETMFGESVSAIDQHQDGARVSFEAAAARDFDLVIGADGLHSKTRELAFGPEERFEKFLGYYVAAFTIDGYSPRDELVYVSYTKPGMQAARFAMRGGRTLAFFIVREELVGEAPGDDPAVQKALLTRIFKDAGWECSAMLDAMAETDDFYFDRVSQIIMNKWTSGRVALVGDAAACVSLLAGEGTGLAMCEAYVLACELHRTKGDYATAFAAYEQKLQPFLTKKQNAAAAFAPSFAPKTAFGVAMRNLVTRMMGLPFVADLAIGGSLKDDFDLPDCGI